MKQTSIVITLSDERELIVTLNADDMTEEEERQQAAESLVALYVVLRDVTIDTIPAAKDRH